MANDALLNAKQQKNDEFYTLYEYIQKEINAQVWNIGKQKNSLVVEKDIGEWHKC